MAGFLGQHLLDVGGGHVALHRVAADLGRVARPEVVAHATLGGNRVQLRV